jgi:hypothetical protein
MESDPTRMCELLVGLPAVNVLGVDDEHEVMVVVHIEARSSAPPCPGCGGSAWVKDRPAVELVDPALLRAPSPADVAQAPLALPRRRLPGAVLDRRRPADRAGPRGDDRPGRPLVVCEQVGRLGRTVAEVARELGCDWHTVNDAVIAYGAALVEDPARVGEVEALGLDKTLFCRQGGGALRLGAVRSSMSAPATASCWMWSRAAAQRGPAAGSRPAPRRGAGRSASACWTCWAPTARPSTTRSPTSSRSPIRSTS